MNSLFKAKTITLSGTETEVKIPGYNTAVRNDSTTVVYMSAQPGVVPGADGVVSIPAGGSVTVAGADGKIFLLGTGEVLVIGSGSEANPFNTSAQLGGSGADEQARAAISVHSGNADIHISADERNAWNGKAELSDIPNTLPANGGNSDTVDGKHSEDFLLKTGGTMTGTLNISDKPLWFGVDGSVQFYVKWENGLLGLYNHDGILLAYSDYGKFYANNLVSLSQFDALVDRVTALENAIDQQNNMAA